MYLEYRTIEHNEAYAEKSYDRPQKEPPRETFFIAEAGKQHGEYRRSAHDERYIGGDAIVESGVLGKKVERASREATDGKAELIKPRVGPHLMGANPR
jgi:hypothetical protein